MLAKGKLGWIFLGGCLGICLLGFIFIVWPLWGEKKRLLEQIRVTTQKQVSLLGASSDIYNVKARKILEEHQQALTRVYANIISFFQEYDDELNRWFDKLVFISEGNPAIQDFQNKYNSYLDKLQSDLHGVEASDSVLGRDEVQRSPPSGSPVSEWLRSLQERFWVREKIIDAIMATNTLAEKTVITKIERMRFGDPKQLPLNLGSILTFDVQVPIPYEQIPNFLKILMNQEVSPKLLLHIPEIEILSTDFKFGDINVSEVPRPVQLTIRGEVFDIHAPKEKTAPSSQ